MDRLPRFLAIGDRKAASTSLYNYLIQHPGIFMPYKDPSFFLCVDEEGRKRMGHFSDNRATDIEEYKALFDKARDDQIPGELSHDYLRMHEIVIPQIKRFIPDHRSIAIIGIIRNPIDRAYSNYINNFKSGIMTESFEEHIKHLTENSGTAPGMRSKAVKAWIEEFPKCRIFIMDDLANDPQTVMREIFGLIGADTSFAPDTSVRHNPAGKPRSILINRFLHEDNLLKKGLRSILPKSLLGDLWWIAHKLNMKIQPPQEMSEDQRAAIAKVYRDDILRLQEIIRRDLGVWLS
jgi:hypothetical protein